MNRKKVNIITNIILSITLVVVVLVGASSSSSIPIYGGKILSPYYNGNTSKNNVSLMFNVYKSADTVKKIVEVLNENDVKATFFIGGCWADDNGETLLYLVKNGEEIANHGYFHKEHKNLSYKENYKEIENTAIVIQSLCGVKPTLFAPPSGSFGNATLEASFNLNNKVIMWSVDTIDWRDKDSDLVYKRATKNVKNGDLILMHPETHTLNALSNIIKTIKEKGFNIVKVSENIQG